MKRLKCLWCRLLVALRLKSPKQFACCKLPAQKVVNIADARKSAKKKGKKKS